MDTSSHAFRISRPNTYKQRLIPTLEGEHLGIPWVPGVENTSINFWRVLTEVRALLPVSLAGTLECWAPVMGVQAEGTLWVLEAGGGGEGRPVFWLGSGWEGGQGEAQR